MKKTLPLFLFFGLFTYSCNSNQLDKKFDKLSAKVDSLEKHALIFPLNTNDDDRTYKFDWFDLGKAEHQIIERVFYVSNIKTVFRDNGYQVTGTIGNTSSMSISNGIIECAVKDTTLKAKVISGTADIPNLLPGAKESFSVFIPTIKRDISEIGILLKDYRM